MLNVFWNSGPYIVTMIFIVGMFWRYKFDRYGWTSRSSQIYESRLLRIGSPLFHIGLLMALGGHVMGLMIPASFTESLGISEHLYHLVAVALGTIAGVMVVFGMTILIYRRRTVLRVFQVTTKMDKLMYLVLGSLVLLGVYNTIGINLLDLPGKYPDGYNYRETVSVWFRSIATFNPKAELMKDAPLTFQLHALVAMALIAIIPITRLVHIFSAPVGYLSRPYLVYRKRTTKKARRGWEPTQVG
ncbi:MAG: respiratory nitrate reductase subunit gamma [Actinobacteria bacterium]|nr:respiratory nitrate reductase subunit gamma [Actinomycetota bacterium]